MAWGGKGEEGVGVVGGQAVNVLVSWQPLASTLSVRQKLPSSG